jgi:diguanylate cyclase (GGDEF)-like protein
MKNKLYNTIGFKIITYYVFLSLITLSFIISIIFENQVDLISKNTVLESEKQLSQLLSSMKKFSMEMKKGSLFKITNEEETFVQLMNIIKLHYRDFLVFSDKNTVIFKSVPGMSLPDTFKEDGMRSMTAMTFSGKNYYLRIDENHRVINFYIPLSEFQSGNSILLIKKSIASLNESLINLYKQAVYVILVVFFFHVLFALILYRSFIHPIKILDEAAVKLADGHLDTRISLPGRNDELKSLADTFNSMAESLHDNISSLSSEIMKTRDMKAETEKISVRDELTGLLNINYFSERLEEEIKIAKLKKKDISLILITPDNFSGIAGIYGKQTGDIIILETAKSITPKCINGEITARTGNEEFAIFKHEPSMENIKELARNIQSSVGEKEIITPDGRFSISVSIGVAYINADGLDHIAGRNDLIESARSALMKAKAAGENGIEFST